MAENDKRKFDLPWATLLPVLAALAGLVAQYKPLVSTRPTIPSEKAIAVIAEQDVDARLWQDPISVAQKQKALLDAQIETHVAKKGSAESHDISALADLLHERVSTFPECVLLLAVMVDAGPYSEQGESRLRSRQAVLEGLSESGFIPIDGEHIGFVTDSWPPPPPPAPPNAPEPQPTPNAPSIERALLLPWEECEAIDDPNLVSPYGTKRVVVLWLPAVNFNPFPLSRFASVINKLAADIRDKIEIKLIGPANSAGLLNMVREVYWWNPLGVTTQEALDGLSIISPRATASDRATFSSAAIDEKSMNGLRAVKDLLETKAVSNPSRGGLHFARTIATDDRVLHAVSEELAARRIAVGPPNFAHIVILSEWDTPYGRSLSKTFASPPRGQSANNVIEQPNERRRLIHPYYYLRGIDGQLPGDPAKDNQREQGQKIQFAQDSVAVEATEGLNQSDYLRRVARQMREDNVRWQREDGFGIRAIGLLGSDIYDKLMILRALRPQFPDAVFFTNNYDAHFERRDDWDDTHNLVIASPFGSTVPEIYPRHHIAPFRDNNQTSMYIGTLVSTERMKEEEAECLTWQPRVFEISRHGAYDLSPPWYLWRPGDSEVVFESHYDKNDKTKTWFPQWLFSRGVIWKLCIIALAMAAIAIWIRVTIARRMLPGGGTAGQRLKRLPVSTIFWVVCGGPLIIFLVALVAQSCAADEPLAFFSGISIWPTEMLRMIALMLAIFFMIKASVDLRANASKLEADFVFAPLPFIPLRWRHIGIGLEHWQLNESARTSRLSAEEAWHAYLCRNKFWPRLIRVGILFLLYFVFAFIILRLTPQPLSPARGEAAFMFDATAFILAGIGMLLLSFYVVDAIQLNSNFVRMFAREVTKWGRHVIKQSHRSPPLTEEQLSPYQEIFFIAQRTQAVAPLIWYPLIVLTLLILARSSFFDNWTWPIGLVLIYAITAAWAVGSAILLRRAAEQLRETALNDLRRLRLEFQKIQIKRQTFDELIAEIRDLKTGAFAPLTEQPFVQAILFPGGGLGLLAVGQRLFDIF